MEIIKIEVDDVPFGYDCVICRERYSTRLERNDHLETHFIHKKCSDCNRLVILIGDLEFELHRPAHCTKVCQSDSNDYEDLQPFVAIERLKDVAVDVSTEDNDDDDEALNKTVMKEETDSDDCPLSIVADISRHTVCEQVIFSKEDDDPPEQPKPSKRKRNRKKPTKKDEDIGEDKKSARIQKSRPVKIIACNQEGCTEEFRQKQLLRKHLKTVHGIVEKHLCSICKFAFADKSNLKHHMVTHTDDKRFICSFCGARFHKLTNMTEHMNAHLGLKPYKCEICGKDFGRSNHKRQHMRVHTGEKPYICQIVNDCTRAYMFKIDLKRHQRSVHGIIEKTFTCKICDKIFYENKYLTKHMATAHS
ncbi:zinc finger protein 577-like [Sitodiplosis mosellana]|uniref:zinc finger protein 577-like n=1 Tax=Sitodiplosis mosellana TaxID=263140 RepID=UPI0024452C95|nr:zinc finger protein 577-like [Sitodiplosis mosellana]